MAYKVTLKNPSKTTGKDPGLKNEASIDKPEVYMSRMTYQLLGSLFKNKTIFKDYNDGKLTKEYVRILDDLNDLHNSIYYPDLVVKEPTNETRALDEYLGSLGIDEEYPYSKDRVNIEQWLDDSLATPMRVIFDEDDDTYLYDPVDGTVLVRIL